MPTIKFHSVVKRQSVEIDVSKVELVTMKNGRPAAQALDPETGTKLFKILGAADKALIEQAKAKKG